MHNFFSRLGAQKEIIPVEAECDGSRALTREGVLLADEALYVSHLASVPT